MNTDRIVIRRSDPEHGYYNIEADGKISTYLCCGEMIEMLIHLTHPDIKGPRYHWRTVDEEIAEDARRAATFVQPAPTVTTTHKHYCDICFQVRPNSNACGRQDCDRIPF